MNITLTDSSDVFLLYMSCLRGAMAARECEVTLDDLDALLPAIEPARIANVALRDVDYELDLYEPQPYLSSPPAPAPEKLVRLRAHLSDYVATDAQPESSVQIPRELWQRLMIVASRYAIGRATYIVGWQASMLEASHGRGELDNVTTAWIVDYITSRDQNEDGHQLGMDMDRHRWVQCAKQMMEQPIS